MSIVLFLVIAGVVGAAALHLPSTLLAGALIALRWSSSPRILDFANDLDRFFNLHGMRYEAPYKISFRRDGSGWIQSILAPLAVLWKFIAVGAGLAVAMWVLGVD